MTKGFIVRPVVPPTVPPGGERVRVCLRAEMSKEALDGLVAALEAWAEMRMKTNAERRRPPRHEMMMRSKL